MGLTYANNGQVCEFGNEAHTNKHTVTWKLAAPVDGVAIDSNTGVLTVTANQLPGTTTNLRIVAQGGDKTSAWSSL